MSALEGLGIFTRLDLSKYAGRATFNTNERLLLHAGAASALTDLLDYWVTQEGNKIHFNRIYALISEQIEIRKRKGPEFASKPGMSGHNWMVATDYNTADTELNDNGRKGMNAEFQKLAGSRGFQGISNEPWHIHYLRGFDSNGNFPNLRDFIYQIAQPELPMEQEEITQRLSDFGYSTGYLKQDTKSFQIDYGFRNPEECDGIPGQNTQRMLVLVKKALDLEAKVTSNYNAIRPGETVYLTT